MSGLRYPICLALAFVPLALVGLWLDAAGAQTVVYPLAGMAYGVLFLAPIADALESYWLRLTDSNKGGW